MEALKQSLRTYAESLRGQHATRNAIAAELDRLADYIPSPDPRPAAQPGVVKALDAGSLAVTVANIRKGESSSPRCEPPGQYEIDIAKAWVGRVLKAIDLALAAPVSQEPVARSDVFDWLETELRAVDCRYRGDPAYDHDAYWFRDRALNIVAEARRMFASPQPLTEGEPSEAEVERAARAIMLKMQGHDFGHEDRDEYIGEIFRTTPVKIELFERLATEAARAALLAAKSKGGQADG